MSKVVKSDIKVENLNIYFYNQNYFSKILIIIESDFCLNFVLRDFDDRANSPGSSFPGFGDPESALRAFGFGFPDSRGFGFGSPDSRGFDFGARFGSGAPESGVQTFSYSRSSKTIRRPDGSIETEERSR